MNDASTVCHNIDLSTSELITKALEKGEGVLSANEALTANTGMRTGRSPKDRFIVKDKQTEDSVDWNAINQPFKSEHFESLWQRASEYLGNKECYISHLWVGAEPLYSLPVKLISELAWHNLFGQ